MTALCVDWLLDGMNEVNGVGVFNGISKSYVEGNVEGCADGELDDFDEGICERNRSQWQHPHYV